MKEGMHSSHQSLLKVFVCAVVLQFGSAFVGPTTARFVPSCSAGAEHAISRSLATRPLPPRRQRFARQVPGRGLSVGSLSMAKKWTGGPGPLPPGPSNLGKGLEKDGGDSKKGAEEGEEQESGLEDRRLYKVTIARSTGIEWGTDISFSWVYVRDLQPSGAAALSGEVSIGDQLIAINDVSTVGSPFDFAMDTMIGLQGPEVEFTFFRGTKDELKDAVGAEDPPAEITVTVLQKGKEDVTLKAPSGANLRNLLTDNEINVYQSVTRWTNCKGKQLCGTCIVDINKGLDDCTIRSLDESSTLRDNPASYRLSCVTDMYDDVTVTVFPPVGAAQWTR